MPGIKAIPWKQNFLANCWRGACRVLKELLRGMFLEAMWIHKCYSDIICWFGVALMTTSTGCWIPLCFRWQFSETVLQYAVKLHAYFQLPVWLCLLSTRNTFPVGQVCFLLVAFSSSVLEFSFLPIATRWDFTDVYKCMSWELHYVMKAKYLVKLLYMANPSSLPPFLVFSLETASTLNRQYSCTA